MGRRNIARKGFKLAGHSAWAIGKTTYRASGTLLNHLFRWMTTDHMGIGRSLSNMPRMGFLDSLSYIAMTVLAGLVGALVAGVTAFVLIAYGIPLFLHFLFFM